MFNWIRKKVFIENETPEIIINNFTYIELIEITKILTKNDTEVNKVISMLVNEPENFTNAHQKWLEEIGLSTQENPTEITMYLLTEHDIPYHFGGHLDWKADTEDILWSLEDGI